jgi:hypothetical protein
VVGKTARNRGSIHNSEARQVGCVNPNWTHGDGLIRAYFSDVGSVAGFPGVVPSSTAVAQLSQMTRWPALTLSGHAGAVEVVPHVIQSTGVGRGVQRHRSHNRYAVINTGHLQIWG